MLVIAKINKAKKLPFRLIEKILVNNNTDTAQKKSRKFKGQGGPQLFKIISSRWKPAERFADGSEKTKTNRKGLVADLSLISKLHQEVISTWNRFPDSAVVACEQALLFGQAKRPSRERALSRDSLHSSK